MPKPENDLLDAPWRAIVMTQKEEMSVLCRIVLPAVLRLDALAEKRDPERIQTINSIPVNRYNLSDIGAWLSSSFSAATVSPMTPFYQHTFGYSRSL